ncbi:MAG: GNAT family N-acetyltransferase [Succinivibrio sp.]|jgi:ribosomal protein S18 acetylase RimI-like enzyme|nr:GNAT family N-acetyltransferase [Succinivibrio sp.]
MIRVATNDDIQAIADSYTEVIKHEQEQHVCHTNWKLGIYPTIAVPKARVPTKTVFVLEENNEICASMSLDKSQDPGYKELNWKYDATPDEVLVIHTLCVRPSKSGHGYGRAMVEFAKQYAKEHGCKVIRLDTYVHNEPAKKLYEKNGFSLTGTRTIFLHNLFNGEQVFMECKLD